MAIIGPEHYVGVGQRREVFSIEQENIATVLIDAGGGNDIILVLSYPYLGLFVEQSKSSIVIAGGGDDIVVTGSARDIIYGDTFDGNSGGADFISSGWGSDIVYGGFGNDTVVGDESFFPREGFSIGGVSGQYFPGRDFIDGGMGNDVIFGMGGGDVLLGGEGDDVIYGNGSVDRNGARLTRTQTVDFDGNNDTAQTFTFQVEEGYDGYGLRETDEIMGGNGNDTLFGQLGTDFLFGESGDDRIAGGEGADVIDGGAGNDFAIYEAKTVSQLYNGQVYTTVTGVIIRLDYQTGSDGDGSVDVLTNIEGIEATQGSDYIYGDSQNNILIAKSHNDWVFGQGGDDWIFGGSDSDQIFGGSGHDWLYGGPQNDQFWFLASDLATGGHDRIMDWGQAGDFDYIRFEGSFASPLIFLDGAGYAQITTQDIGMSGGIIVYGATAESVQAHLIFG